MISEGDKVVWRFTARGTHQGELMGIPSTGKQATVTGMVISHFADGKWAEDWHNHGTLGDDGATWRCLFKRLATGGSHAFVGKNFLPANA